MPQPPTTAVLRKEDSPSWVRRHWKLTLCLVLAVVVAGAFVFLGTKSEQGVLLGAFAGKAGMAKSINNAGQVVGWAETKNGPIQAFLWTKEGGMQNLGVPGYMSEAASINGKGHVVGSCFGVGGRNASAFLWTREHGIQLLGSFGGDSEATAINDAMQVAGDSETKDNKYHVFLWTTGQGMQDLGTLGGENAYASSINNLGQIVGISDTASGKGRRAFLWTKEDGMQDLGTLGGNFSYASCINDSGQVVGSSSTKSGESHAFLWTKTGGMLDLGTLGGKTSQAAFINNHGQIVGYWETKDGKMHAFLWTKQHGMKDLGTLGREISYAESINDAGQIVGFVYSSPAWWMTSWNWFGEKLKLPSKYCFRKENHLYMEAVLWEALLSEKDAE